MADPTRTGSREPEPASPVSSVALVLRLAGPLQSWGASSQYNRRETAGEPTKGGVIGLLAAAQGRRRSDPIEDLLALTLAVRSDQSGTLLRDYHTVSDYRGNPLPSAAVNAKGIQKPAGDKQTHVTQRHYLQDAVFVAAIAGPAALLADLADALQRPAFPLALGRRACVPTQPLILAPPTEHASTDHPNLWNHGAATVLDVVPWQAGPARRRELERAATSRISLPVTIDDPTGDDLRNDIPSSFSLVRRTFSTRRVRHAWVHIPTPFAAGPDPENVAGSDNVADAGNAVSNDIGDVADSPDDGHDPFALLDW